MGHRRSRTSDGYICNAKRTNGPVLLVTYSVWMNFALKKYYGSSCFCIAKKKKKKSIIRVMNFALKKSNKD